MEAYEIRLELLKMAKDLLMEDWRLRHEALQNVYSQRRDMAMSREYNQVLVDYPELPSMPSSIDINNLATEFNTFVSKRG